MQYLKGGFCYTFDKETKEKYEITKLIIPSLSKFIGSSDSSLSPSSVSGSSNFLIKSSGFFSIDFNQQLNGWSIYVNISLSNESKKTKNLIGYVDVLRENSDDLILLHPVKPPVGDKRRSAYVHKNSGLLISSNSSSLSFDNQPVDLSFATSSIGNFFSFFYYYYYYYYYYYLFIILLLLLL